MTPRKPVPAVDIIEQAVKEGWEFPEDPGREIQFDDRKAAEAVRRLWIEWEDGNQ